MDDLNFNQGLSCESARRLFDALLRGELEAEPRGRVKGHLLHCESCVIAYRAAIAEFMEREPLARENAPPLPIPPEPILRTLGMRHPPTEPTQAVPPAPLADSDTGIRRVAALFKQWVEWIRRFVRPAPTFASLAVALALISYVIHKERQLTRKETLLNEKERTLAEQGKSARPSQDQEAMASYEKKIAELDAELRKLKEKRAQPQVALSIYTSIPLPSKSGQEPIKPLRIEFTEKVKSVSLGFSFFVQDYKTYQVEIYDTDGNLRWESGPRPIIVLNKGEPTTVFSLEINEDSFPPGEYGLRIYGTNQRRQLIAKYPLHVTARRV